MTKWIKRTAFKLVNEIHALAWTLAGTGTVLITLSGNTRTQGIWISAIALVVHLLGVVAKRENQ
jgi:hypothetical protein